MAMAAAGAPKPWESSYPELTRWVRMLKKTAEVWGGGELRAGVVGGREKSGS